MKIVINGVEVEASGSGNGADLTVGDGLTQDGDEISVTTPTRGILTQEEFDALPEEQRNKGMYVVYDGENGGGTPSVSGGSVPSGFIGMWSGTTVPDGWALCDGQNGTPDLRGRFVLGESNSHAMHETGGSETVALTRQNIPPFDMETGTANVMPDANGAPFVTSVSPDFWDNGSPHNNMPPYYVLAYIMKL